MKGFYIHPKPNPAFERALKLFRKKLYSRLDNVHGLDDDDVVDCDKVSELHDKLNKVLEKWK